MTFKFKKEAIIFFAIFLAACLFVFLLLNGGAYLRILRYDENQPILSLKKSSELPPASNNKYQLYIPKIDASAPVVFPKSDSNQDVLAGLEEGVVLYPGSQLPGKDGRSIILGHSSKVDWYKGQYAYIFALLNKLQGGDEFYIISGNKKLVYKVFSNGVLTPKQADELLSQTPENESDAVLITCWPIGSSSKRTVIQAELDRIEKI